MTDLELLARWQGIAVYDGIPNDYILPFIDKQAWLITHTDKPFSWRPAPDYPNDAAACDSLLDTLVEKGYIPQLFYNTFWHFEVYSDNEFIFRTFKYTRREAIIAVCLEVARKEIEENTNAKKSCTT